MGEMAKNTRKLVAQLEEKLWDMPQAEITLKHYFASGVYAREMFAPAGTVAVGKILLVDNIVNLSKGKVSVYTEDGGVLSFEAPYQWIAPAGTKRVAYFHTDTVWTVYLATELTDPIKIEEECTTQSYEDPRLVLLEIAKTQRRIA